MEWWGLFQAFLLGIVEGITEFLPISSTGHLIVVGNWIGFHGKKGDVFDIFIQMGAILAVCWEYRSLFLQKISHLQADPTSRRFWMNLIVATFPVLVAGFFLHSFIKSVLFNPVFVGFALLIGGVILLLFESKVKEGEIEKIEDISLKQSFGIGCVQILSLCPGVSRAAATILGGIGFGLKRPVATQFSFFLAVPALTAASLYELLKNFRFLTVSDAETFFVGFMVSFFVALLVIRFLIRYVAHRNFVPFGWYRILLGIVVLVIAFR